MGIEADDGGYAALLHYDLGRAYYSMSRLADALFHISVATAKLPALLATDEIRTQVSVGISKALGITIMKRVVEPEYWGDARADLKRAASAIETTLASARGQADFNSVAELEALLSEVQSMVRRSWLVPRDDNTIRRFYVGEDDE